MRAERFPQQVHDARQFTQRILRHATWRYLLRNLLHSGLVCGSLFDQHFERVACSIRALQTRDRAVWRNEDRWAFLLLDLHAFLVSLFKRCPSDRSQRRALPIGDASFPDRPSSAADHVERDPTQKDKVVLGNVHCSYAGQRRDDTNAHFTAYGTQSRYP